MLVFRLKRTSAWICTKTNINNPWSLVLILRHKTIYTNISSIQQGVMYVTLSTLTLRCHVFLTAQHGGQDPDSRVKLSCAV